MYYFYRKSNRGHRICLLYRGCPPFGESVIRGFTVYQYCKVGNSGEMLSLVNWRIFRKWPNLKLVNNA